MAFGQGNNLYRRFNNETLRDYQHASKVFRTNGYQNAPRLKFLFHVYFNINTVGIPTLGAIYDSLDISTIGVLVKTIQLPQFQIQTDTLNQYNRKRIIQKKIDYQPVQIEFHDDGGDLIRGLWYNYFAYYYKDPSQKYGNPSNTNGALGVNSLRSAGFNYNARDIYAANRAVNDWGFIGESYSDSTNSANGKPAFFNDITIYGFDQHKFVQYTLVNPVIQTWNHDQYDYSADNGTMKNSVTIQYETVKYYSGAIGSINGDNNIPGFASPALYDARPSFLKTEGGDTSITGQGGQLNVYQGQIQDLQAGSVASPIGGTQTPNVLYEQQRILGELTTPNPTQPNREVVLPNGETKIIKDKQIAGPPSKGYVPPTAEELNGFQKSLPGSQLAAPGVTSNGITNNGINFPTGK